MARSVEFTAAIENEEDNYLAIRDIGKHERPKKDGNQYQPDNFYWTYVPSGRICTYVKRLGYQDDGLVYIFIFLDLVEKISFEVPIVYDDGEKNNKSEDGFEDNSDDEDSKDDSISICNYYFTGEDEIIVVSACGGLFEQLVYKIDYINQTMDLKETISHDFEIDDDNFAVASCRNMFVKWYGVEYLVLVEDCEETNDPQPLYTICMIPKSPADRNAPLKKYQFNISEKTVLERKLWPFMKQNGYKANVFTLQADSCIIHGSKLWLSHSYLAVLPSGKHDHGHLIGGYWEVDLAKLVEIPKNEVVDKEKVMETQADACQFVQHGSLQLTELYRFSHFEKDVGFFYICENKEEYRSVAYVYPSNMSQSSKPITLDFKFEYNHYDTTKWNYKFSFHPHGALLNFNDEEAPIEICVLKSFKLNLMSLAFNKVLFHKNTPIRNHPAYRLCFNGEKPIVYFNIVPRKSLKRKHSD